MGGFLSLRIEMPDTGSLQPSRLLTSCFSSSFFTPVALGGVEVRKDGDDWFLAGYALEEFVSRFIARGIAKPASIHRMVSAGNAGYLDSVAEALNRRSISGLRISPFETVDADVTCVPAVRLDAAVLNDADVWVTQHSKAAVSLYGTVDLADRPCAFRFCLPGDMALFGAPFLWIRLGLSPFLQGVTEMLIYSQSPVWLQSDQGALAEVNLDRLAAFAFGLLSDTSPLSVTLRLDGASFEAERPRIERALAGIIHDAPNRNT